MLYEFEQSDLLLAWGVTTALGWLATMIMAVVQPSVPAVMAIWTVLMAIPVVITMQLYAAGNSNKLFNFWAVAVSLLMVENFVTPASISVYSYFLLWMAASAAGFYYTSRKMPPPSDTTYKYAAILAAIALPVVYYDYRAGAILGILLQGGPMLYDYWTVHR